MKNYYRLMLGRGSKYASDCRDGSFVGVNFELDMDFTGKLHDDARSFNKTYVPKYQECNPQKTKISAGLACGMIWTVSKGMKTGDILLCPDGSGQYMIAEIAGDYQYRPDGILRHQRPVRWLNQTISREDMGGNLKRSCGAVGTVCNITKHTEEIITLTGDTRLPKIIATDETIEDPSVFAMEMHLEEFLVRNWRQTELGKQYDIYEDEEGKIGQQYPTDTGPLDILAISKDKKTLLVVELKRGRASDSVVGQILRYMGYVTEVLAEEDQNVRGVVIALDDDQRLRRALAVVDAIDFFRYQVSFKLVKA